MLNFKDWLQGLLKGQKNQCKGVRKTNLYQVLDKAFLNNEGRGITERSPSSIKIICTEMGRLPPRSVSGKQGADKHPTWCLYVMGFGK